MLLNFPSSIEIFFSFTIQIYTVISTIFGCVFGIIDSSVSALGSLEVFGFDVVSTFPQADASINIIIIQAINVFFISHPPYGLKSPSSIVFISPCTHGIFSVKLLLHKFIFEHYIPLFCLPSRNYIRAFEAMNDIKITLFMKKLTLCYLNQKQQLLR